MLMPSSSNQQCVTAPKTSPVGVGTFHLPHEPGGPAPGSGWMPVIGSTAPGGGATQPASGGAAASEGAAASGIIHASSIHASATVAASAMGPGPPSPIIE